MKILGPLMSQQASGTFAGLFEYSRHREGHRAGRRRRPTQPRTLAQRATRILAAGLAALWSDLTPADVATWDHADLDHTIAPYHRYLRFNSKRLNVQADILTLPREAPYWPSTVYEPAMSGTTNTPATTSTTAVSGGFDHTFTMGSYSASWVLQYWRQTAEHPNPHPRTRIAMFKAPPSGAQTMKIRNVQAGTYTVHYIISTRQARRAFLTQTFLATALP